MGEGTARDHFIRAPRTRTQPSGEAMELSVGDIVDSYISLAPTEAPAGRVHSQAPMSPTSGMEQLRCVGMATPLNVEYMIFVMPESAPHSWPLRTFT
eukprot:2626718-Lingulodinium_polyedra.AAC.1